MLKNYWLIAIRNILRHKVFSIINIVGLSIGIAASIFILKYVNFEMSYEDFNQHSRNVYRIQVNKYQNNELQFKSARSYPGLAQLLEKEIPEILYTTRAYPELCVFKYGDKKISEQPVLWVDDPFVKMFDLKFIKQSASEPLKNTYSSVITKSAAERIFGNEEPIGKTIILNEGVPFIVNGVVEDYPQSTHLKFDFLLSMNTIGALDGYDVINSIYYNWLYTYIMVKPGSSPELTESKFVKVIDKNFTYLKDSNSRLEMFMQPIQDIHLKSDLNEEISPNSNMKTIYYFSAVAFVILFMAWINFINLSTARALDRAKEVGMRKVVGANRLQVIMQFILESVLLNIIAFIIAIGIVELFIPTAQQILAHDIKVSIFSSMDYWLIIFVVFLLCGIVAGFYPALLLSSFNPSVVLKGKFRNTGKGAFIRKTLVVFQFSAAVALIISTFVISRQIEFVQKQHLGFSTEQVLCINSPRSLINNPTRVSYFDRFKETLLKNNSIKQVTAADVIPGQEIVFHLENFAKLGSQPRNISISGANVDWDFFETLDINFAAGRSFSKFFSTDSFCVVLNETASRLLGFETPNEAVNNFLVDNGNGNQIKILGVVADYHHEHFKKSVEPMIYFQGHRYQFGYFPVKLNTKNIAATIDQISQVWQQVYPNDPFDFFFLDEFFNRQYKADLQFEKTVSIFSLLSIIIASLGLFGLSTLVAVQRTKEIGIRKALGASLPNLLYQLSRDFLFLVLLANIIAWPFVYYFLNEWLKTFTLSIELNILFFLIPGLLVMILAIITMSFQIFRVAKENPIKSLKYE